MKVFYTEDNARKNMKSYKKFVSSLADLIH